MKQSVPYLLLTVLLTCITADVYAQPEVTFQINLEPLVSNETFLPDRDYVELVGNLQPLSMSAPMRLTEDESDTGLYTISVSFPPYLSGRELQYRFRLNIDNEVQNEDIPRIIRIPENNITLDALYFNTYAW